MYYLRLFLVLLLFMQLFGCATQQVRQCPAGTQDLPDCPPASAVNDGDVNKLYDSRTWMPAREVKIDTIKLGEQARVPINEARTKVIGPTYDDSLTSLAAKIWLIENAQHTIDAMYYIFKPDVVGYSILGALCNAVQRGIDVRLMVDSVGSMSPTHNGLRALETCAEDAGFMRNADGKVTTKRARVQVVIFNAISKFNFNRRSHDKILIVDGHIPEKMAVMTGGRNISKDYYGINKDGSQDPSAFRDLELFLRSSQDENTGDRDVGGVSEIYYTLLFLHKGNKRLRPLDDDEQRTIYQKEREKSQQKLAFLKSLPLLQKHLQAMPSYTSEGFRSSKVRLAHQLGNLTNKEVTTKVLENVENNPNSILYLISQITDKRLAEGATGGTLRIVSPYLFAGLYYNAEGEVVYDGAKNLLKAVAEDPSLRIEIVTNSVMTSDNFFTQAIIDFDMAPRLLLTPEMQEAWLSAPDDSDTNPTVAKSDEWNKLINHPQVFIYQTGKLDSVLFPNGTVDYGKLHAKFIFGEKVGFIGTSNFDYRSNLYNNEMGFFYQDDELHKDLVKIFELLKSTSYRWGTPEWLQMRKELMASDNSKAGPARKQRFWFKTTRALGIEYLM